MSGVGRRSRCAAGGVQLQFDYVLMLPRDDLGEDVVAMAVEAISEAVETACVCFAQSLSRQLAATL